MLPDITSWASEVIGNLGYAGVTILVAIETIFPPIAGPVLPLAGFVAGRGDASLIGMVCAATIGSTVGAWFIYGLSAMVGPGRLRHAVVRWFRWTGLSERHFDRADRWFAGHADAAVLLGRCVPVVRSLVSIPAGVQRMPLPRFTALTVAGNLVWNLTMISAGAILGSRWTRIGDIAGLIQAVIIIVWSVVLGVVLWRRVIRPRLASAGELPPAD